MLEKTYQAIEEDLAAWYGLEDQSDHHLSRIIADMNLLKAELEEWFCREPE